MKRHEAIEKAMLVTNYLSMNERAAHLTLDINRYDTSIHYFHENATEKETRRIAKKLESLSFAGSRLNLLAGSRLYFNHNDKLDFDTFDLIWDIDNDLDNIKCNDGLTTPH